TAEFTNTPDGRYWPLSVRARASSGYPLQQVEVVQYDQDKKPAVVATIPLGGKVTFWEGELPVLQTLGTGPIAIRTTDVKKREGYSAEKSVAITSQKTFTFSKVIRLTTPEVRIVDPTDGAHANGL